MNLAIKISFRLSAASTACKAGRPWAACFLAARLPPWVSPSPWAKSEHLLARPHIPSWESLPTSGSRSQQRNWLWNYLGPFPQAAEGFGMAVGGRTRERGRARALPREVRQGVLNWCLFNLTAGTRCHRKGPLMEMG